MKDRILYFENLDGLRLFAFLPVFLRHSFHTEYDYIKSDSLYLWVSNFWINGNLGVNFFFVLSGFLITYLLLNEKKVNGSIDIKSFYIRRTLRIWPLYFATVVFGFLIFPLLKSFFNGVPDESASAGNYILFLSNFDIIENGLPDSSVLSVLWSVAIEEQFYLVWPWIFFLLPRNRYIYAFLGVIILSLAFRAFNLQSHPHILKYHTLSVISDMAIGGICAYFSFYSPKFTSFFETMKKEVIIFIYITGFLIIAYSAVVFDFTISLVLKNIVLGLFFAFVIAEQNYSQNSFYKAKDWKVISWLGRLTYGLYCLHFIGILTATTISALIGFNDTVIGVLLFETLLALVITIVISWVSFNYFEKPFLKLKKKFSFISKGKRLV